MKAIASNAKLVNDDVEWFHSAQNRNDYNNGPTEYNENTGPRYPQRIRTPVYRYGIDGY